MAFDPVDLVDFKDLFNGETTKLEEITGRDIADEVDPGILSLGESIAAWVEPYVGTLASNTVATVALAIMYSFIKSAEVVGFAVGTLENARQRGAVNANERFPSSVISTDLAAQMVNQGILNTAEGINEARKNGFDESRFNAIRETQRTHLGQPDLMEMLRRGVLSSADFKKFLKRHAMPPDEEDIVNKLLERLSEPETLLRYWLKTDKNGVDIDKKLSQHGYAKDSVDMLKSLAEFIPPVADLVRMAVREAFDEGQVAKLDLDAEFPGDFKTWANRQGVSEEWAKKYWRAHWELPSPTQAFEMFHRDLIDKDALSALLKAQDYAPTWRDKLLGISYNTITRVDVRRMYEMGIIDGDEVERQYRHGGYSPENAKRLRQFVEADVFESAVSPVRARLLTLYRKGLVDDNELRAFLRDLQMPEDRMERFITAQKMLMEEEHADRVLNAVKKQYLASRIDEVTATARLAALGMSVGAIANTMQFWIEEKRSRITRLSARDIHQALSRGLIDEGKATKWLKDRGMSDEEIKIFIKLDIVNPEEEPLPTPTLSTSFNAVDRRIAKAIAEEEIV